METLSPRRARTDSGGMILDGTMQDAAPSTARRTLGPIIRSDRRSVARGRASRAGGPVADDRDVEIAGPDHTQRPQQGRVDPRLHRVAEGPAAEPRQQHAVGRPARRVDHTGEQRPLVGGLQHQAGRRAPSPPAAGPHRRPAAPSRRSADAETRRRPVVNLDIRVQAEPQRPRRSSSASSSRLVQVGGDGREPSRVGSAYSVAHAPQRRPHGTEAPGEGVAEIGEPVELPPGGLAGPAADGHEVVAVDRGGAGAMAQAGPWVRSWA